MLEAKINFKKSVERKDSKSKVYELFARYEDAFAALKNPSPQHQKEYIDMYFLYLEYMNKKGEKI